MENMGEQGTNAGLENIPRRAKKWEKMPVPMEETTTHRKKHTRMDTHEKMAQSN